MRRMPTLIAGTALILVAGGATPPGNAAPFPPGSFIIAAPTPSLDGDRPNSLSLVSDADGAVTSMPTGAFAPWSAAYSPDAEILYAHGSVDDGFTFALRAYDAATMTELWTVDTDGGDNQWSSDLDNVVVSSDGTVAYTIGNGANRVDLTTRTVSPVSACSEPTVFDIVMSPGGESAWVLCFEDAPVDIEGEVFDLPDFRLLQLDVVSGARGAEWPMGLYRTNGVAITPDGTTALVEGWRLSGGGSAQNLLVKVDLATGTMTESPTTIVHSTIAVSPDGTKAFAGGATTVTQTPDPREAPLVPEDPAAPPAPQNPGSERSLERIDIASLAVEHSAPAEIPSATIGVMPDGARIVAPVEVGADPDVGVYELGQFDSGSLAEQRTSAMGDSPRRFAITPDQAPIARLTATPPNSPVTFDASMSTVRFGTIASYAWDFGDGTTAVTTTPTTAHDYALPGSYRATVTLTSSAGTSTADVYTGRMMLRNGDLSAVAGVSVVVPRRLPATGTAAWPGLVGALAVAIGATLVAASVRRRGHVRPASKA